MEAEPFENYIDSDFQWKGYDWRSHWASVFTNLRLETFNDGYFPTEGTRIALNARYMFNGYSVYMDNRDTPVGEHTEGKVPPIHRGRVGVRTQDRSRPVPDGLPLVRHVRIRTEPFVRV
jgi:hypothetical protein